MKPFNLQDFISNPSRKVVTRDGKSVRILCTDCKGEYPVIALVSYSENSECCEAYTADGIFYIGEESDSDLFFAPVKREGFVNIYNRDNRYIAGVTIHQTEEDAKRFILPNSGYINTIQITLEE